MTARRDHYVFTKIKSGLSYANVMATIAVFLALGGGAYAATRLPRNSVGSKQIKKNAVTSKKVKNGSLLPGDFKGGRLPAGPAGPKGDKGDACTASDPACRGPKGDTGPRGPGSTSFDGQFPNDAQSHLITSINGIDVKIFCANAGGTGVGLSIERTDTAHDIYGWGTLSTGGAIGRASVTTLGDQKGFMLDSSTNTAELDVVAEGSGPGVAAGYARIDLNGIQGSACNYHALIIPPA
jgi:hypothetical protein